MAGNLVPTILRLSHYEKFCCHSQSCYLIYILTVWVTQEEEPIISSILTNPKKIDWQTSGTTLNLFQTGRFGYTGDIPCFTPSSRSLVLSAQIPHSVVSPSPCPFYAGSFVCQDIYDKNFRSSETVRPYPGQADLKYK